MFPADRRAVLIENKTMGAGHGSLDDYARVVKHLQANGLKAALHVLISRGNPTDSILNHCLEHDLLIILWEDVFRLMAQNPFFSKFFDTDLALYCDFADP
jgi:hypothetical protein